MEHILPITKPTNLPPALKDEELFKQCQEHNASAQKILYENYSIGLMRLCQRYLKDEFAAEEALIQGFYKVFKSIEKVEWRGRSAFNSWIKRVMVNECLMALRKAKANIIDNGLERSDALSHSFAENGIYEQDILKLIAKLPTGYRTVFNLYVIEGYSHKEIADQLGIQESTSKSQLSKARHQLQTWIHKTDSQENTLLQKFGTKKS